MRVWNAASVAVLILAVSFSSDCSGQERLDIEKDAASVRFATFNVSFHRKKEGELATELAEPDSKAPARIAEIIQRIRPDVVLLNEFDFDADGNGVKQFLNNYLAVSQNGQKPIEFEYSFSAPVNTGVDSKHDLNNDGNTGSPTDAFGFGVYPGQYGMVILSKFEINKENARTFQKFLWKDMPGNLLPIAPGTDAPYYNEDVTKIFRLSSKSHWDIPIKVGEKTIHFLTAHPTPPVFDDLEDRNGRRNFDEIRLFADYVTPGKSEYLYDDNGKKGGLPNDANFVIAGDMNADEADGDSYKGAAEQLTKHPLINHELTPISSGGAYFSKSQGNVNESHKGDARRDTGDFNDVSVGNLRLDYCLPSKTLTIKKSGVFLARARSTRI